jgi:hypothetical protein
VLYFPEVSSRARELSTVHEPAQPQHVTQSGRTPNSPSNNLDKRQLVAWPADFARSGLDRPVRSWCGRKISSPPMARTTHRQPAPRVHPKASPIRLLLPQPPRRAAGRWPRWTTSGIVSTSSSWLSILEGYVEYNSFVGMYEFVVVTARFQSRLTSSHRTDEFDLVATRSRARTVETESGIRFHHEVGSTRRQSHRTFTQ